MDGALIAKQARLQTSPRIFYCCVKKSFEAKKTLSSFHSHDVGDSNCGSHVRTGLHFDSRRHMESRDVEHEGDRETCTLNTAAATRRVQINDPLYTIKTASSSHNKDHGWRTDRKNITKPSPRIFYCCVKNSFEAEKTVSS